MADSVKTELHQQGGANGAVSHESQTLVNGEKQADPEELTSGDFANAGAGITGTATAAMQYVKDMVMPSGKDDATNDPEVKDFQQATGEVVESYSEDKDDGGPQGRQSFSTTSVTAGKSGPQSQGFGDMARNTAATVQQKVSPTADAAPREGDGPTSGQWWSQKQYDAADQGQRAADKTSDWFGKQKERADEKLPHDDAPQGLSAAAREARDKVASGAQYVQDRVSGASGDISKEAKEEKESAKGWFFSRKNKAQDEAQEQTDRTKDWLGNKTDEAKDQAEGTRNWLGGKKEEAKDDAREQTDRTRGWLGGKKEEAKDQADSTRGWLGGKKDEAKDQADSTRNWLGGKKEEAKDDAREQADRTRGWLGSKKEEAKDQADSTRGWLGGKADRAQDKAEDQADRTRGWLGKRQDEAEDTASEAADTAKGYYRDAKHEVKREASAAKGWFGGKKEELQPEDDPSQSLGAAYRDAKGKVQDRASHLRDRFTGGNRDEQEAEDKARGFFDRVSGQAKDQYGRAKDQAKDQYGRAKDQLPSFDRRSTELRTREEFDYSSGMIPSNTADERAKFSN